MDTTVLYFNTKNSCSSINQQNFQINYQKDYNITSLPCIADHSWGIVYQKPGLTYEQI